MQEVGPVKDVCPSFLQAVKELLQYRKFHSYHVGSVDYFDASTTIMARYSGHRSSLR